MQTYDEEKGRGGQKMAELLNAAPWMPPGARSRNRRIIEHETSEPRRKCPIQGSVASTLVEYRLGLKRKG
jgi:hypothetical protein